MSAVAENTRAVIGHNQPTPFETAAEEIETLFGEATNWLDGSAISSQAEADQIGKLLDMIRQAGKRADAARVAEKKPHDDAAKAVQAKYKPLLDRVELATDTCKRALTPWLRKLDEEKRAKAEAARIEAEAKQREAEAAIRAARDADLATKAEAEAKLAEAKAADAAATRAANDRARATGGARAVSLRTTYTAEVSDLKAFMAWCWQHKRTDIEEFAGALASRLIRANERGMPGITVHEHSEAV